jgi:hypothetical protein
MMDMHSANIARTMRVMSCIFFVFKKSTSYDLASILDLAVPKQRIV